MIFGGLTSTHLWQPDGMTFGDWQSTPANRRLVQPVDELTTTVTPSRGNDPVQPLAEAQTPVGATADGVLQRMFRRFWT